MMDALITASAAGQNWRNVAQDLLKQLMPALEQNTSRPNIAYLYITDKLVRDAESLVGILRMATNIPQWVGVTASAVFRNDQLYHDKPAASCLLLSVAEEDLIPIAVGEDEYQKDLNAFIDDYLHKNGHVAHFYCHPELGYRPDLIVNDIYDQTMAFMTGGVSSARGAHRVFTQDGADHILAGYAFTGNVSTVSAMFEGFDDIGKEHEITSCRKNEIFALGGRSATDVLVDDLRGWLADQDGGAPVKADAGLDTLLAQIPAQGAEMMMAFRCYRHDIVWRKFKYMSAQNEVEGKISSIYRPEEGDHVAFVLRNAAALKKDLAKNLMALRARLQAEGKLSSIKGAIYISNISRLDKQSPDIELVLIREILGDIPLVGFYAAAELSHHSLYNFTGVLTLFL